MVLRFARGGALSKLAIAKLVGDLRIRAVPRVSLESPGLGGGVLGRADAAVRASVGAREHQQHRGGLPTHRCFRMAADSHGAVERFSGRD